MDYTDKIKAIQQFAGIEPDGIATSKTWIAIYHVLFASVPYDLNISSIIKEVQQKISVRVSGHPSHRTWEKLHEFMMESEAAKDDSPSDPHNEIILKSMSQEVVPFAKELIRLAAQDGIHIRLMCDTADDALSHQFRYKNANSGNHRSSCDFGLVFDIGIYERTSNGDYNYKESSPLYEAVAKLGESIGLTWAGDKKTFTSRSLFELRPAWAVRMKEMEMIKELSRRKRAHINLLAIL